MKLFFNSNAKWKKPPQVEFNSYNNIRSRYRVVLRFTIQSGLSSEQIDDDILKDLSFLLFIFYFFLVVGDTDIFYQILNFQ